MNLLKSRVRKLKYKVKAIMLVVLNGGGGGGKVFLFKQIALDTMLSSYNQTGF